jgi:uncharacterized membrane protein
MIDKTSSHAADTGSVATGVFNSNHSSEIDGTHGTPGFVKTLLQWGIRLAPYCITLPIATFGVQHFIYLQFVADFIPHWIPWRTFWAGFTGVALIAAATGIVFKVWDRAASGLLGLMILLWVLLLHTSRIVAEPKAFAEWRGFFQALAMSGCAFALAEGLAPKTPATAKPRPGIVPGLTRLLKLGTRLAPWFVALSITALGLEHFVFAHVTAPQVPLWIPGTAIGNYLSGAALMACGIGICFQPARRISATLLGILILLSLLFLHLPEVLRNGRFESDWTKTLVISGGAFLLTRVQKRSTVSENGSSAKAPLWLQTTDDAILPRGDAVRSAVDCEDGRGNCRPRLDRGVNTQKRGDTR